MKIHQLGFLVLILTQVTLGATAPDFLQLCQSPPDEAQRLTVRAIAARILPGSSEPDCPRLASALAKLTALDLRGETKLVPDRFGDLRPIASLGWLESLSVARQPEVTDVQPLEALPRLRFLDLIGSGVSDLSPLAMFPALEAVALSGRAIPGIADLVGVTRLTQLALWLKDAAPDADLGTLPALPALRVLVILGGNPAVLEPVGQVHSLDELTIQEAGLTRVDGLAGMTTLRHLDLSLNRITDVSALKTLVKLERLTLTGNPIAKHDCPLSPASICVW
jgi:internalin A